MIALVVGLRREFYLKVLVSDKLTILTCWSLKGVKSGIRSVRLYVKTSTTDQHHYQLTYKGSRSKLRTNSHVSAVQSVHQVGQLRKYIGESDMRQA